MKSNLYVVDVDCNENNRGNEFYVIATTVCEAWEKVIRMKLDAETITIKVTDLDTVYEVMEM